MSKVGIMEMPVFPAADLFPMLDGDALHELAEDIKANGQKEPLVIALVDGVWTLVDGRNRREACRLAGVEPTYRELGDEDPTAFILSVNIHRRHMTKGQRAMAVACMYPDKQQGKKATSVRITEVGGGYLSHARTVYAHAPELVQLVLAGGEPLDAAYKVAKARREAEKTELEKLGDLRKKHPALAVMVEEDSLALDDAVRVAKLPQKYADKVLSGVWQLSQAESEWKQDVVEHDRGIARSIGRIKEWLAVHPLVQTIREDPSRDEVLDAMEAYDRNTFLELEAETWPTL